MDYDDLATVSRCQYYGLSRKITILSALMMLTGCYSGGDVVISYDNGLPIFTVTREDGNQACVQSINVKEGAGEVGSATPWVLIQNIDDIESGKAACYNVFRYGQSVKGYEYRFDRKALTPGKSYTVDISGMGGLYADKLFTVPR